MSRELLTDAKGKFEIGFEGGDGWDICIWRGVLLYHGEDEERGFRFCFSDIAFSVAVHLPHFTAYDQS